MKTAKQDIIEELDALQEQYWPRPVRTQDQHERFLRDYLRDLDGFAAETVRLACTNWRCSDATKFPTPGQLLKLVKALVPKLSAESFEPWATITDAAYSALSLSAKIRHHQILGQDERLKAGPMWIGEKNGRPAAPGELSQAWRTHTDRANGHFAEVKRLRDLIIASEKSA